MTRDEAFGSLAWMVSDDAWAPVDAALWGRCAGFMTPAERDRMNLEARQYLREFGARFIADNT
jgi:hypothetical protein